MKLDIKLIKLKSLLPLFKEADVVILLGILFYVSYYFQFGQSNYMRPQSLHIWRQADCASFAMMYYENGMHFLEPKIYNALSGEGNAVGECPILYYFVACIYKIYGPDESVFRFVNLCIFYFGMIALFRITKRVLADRFFAFVIPLLLFSSPIIMFFANNYLPDVSSLSFTFIAWNYFFKYKENGRQEYFWWSLLFFTLAALLKLNASISFVALAIIFFVEWVGWSKENSTPVFLHKRKNLIGFALAFSVIFLWYWWAIQYNNNYRVAYFATKVLPGWPVWETTEKNLVYTFYGFFTDSVYIFFQPTYILVFFLLFFILANRKSIEPIYFNIFLLIFIGVFLFSITFFLGIRDNIYYCINLLILPVFLFIFSVGIIKFRFPNAFRSLVFRLLILCFLILNLNYAKGTLADFYHGGKLHFKINESLTNKSFLPFLDSIGIKKSDKILSFPDVTPNATLYSIKRQGWTECTINRADTLAINDCIIKGAKYLISTYPYMLTEPAFKNYTGNCIAVRDNINIYKLGIGQRNIKSRNVIIKTKTNHFLSFDKLAIDKKIISVDSTNAISFYLFYINKSHIILKAPSGEVVFSAITGDKRLMVNPGWVGAWEIFQLTDLSDNKFALKAYNNKYVSLKVNEGNILKADADVIGTNETFMFSK